VKRFTGVLATLLVALPGVASAQENPFPLEGLVVTASPTPRPLAALASDVTVLDGAALRARGLVRVEDALREVPGLTVVQNGPMGSTASVFMRGGESDYVLVLVDGVQVNQPGGAFDFSNLTLDNVARIEVVRGPRSALYGSGAVAGVVQIITRDGRGPARAALATRLGSFGREDWSLDASGGGERAGYSVGLSRVHTKGILPFNNGYTDEVASGAFDLAPDDRTRVRFTGRLSHHTYHFPTDGAGNVVDRNSFTYGDESTLGLRADRTLGRRLDVQVNLGTHGLSGGTDDAQDGPADTAGVYASSSLDHMRRSSADVRGNLRMGSLVATLGWEVEQESDRSSTESSSDYGPSSDSSRNARWNRGYYAQLTGSRRWLSYDAGARLEDNQRFGKLWTWQLGGVARVMGSAGPRLRASLGTGIKEPTFYENFATGFARGNPNLAPERSRSWEVGLDQPLVGEDLLLRGTYFDQDFRDLIQYTATSPSPEAPSFYNVARARARGVEVALEGSVGPLWGSASWTWLATKVVNPGVASGPGDEFAPGGELLRRPRHSASLEMGAALGGGVALGGVVNVVGVRADRNFATYPATRVMLPRYTLVSLDASWRVERAAGRRPGVEISVRGENLLNRSYEEVVGFPAPGRAVYVGARVNVGGG
jgi:vitamin B12 transporter